MASELRKKAENWFKYLEDIYHPSVLKETMSDEEMIECYEVANEKFHEFASQVRQRIIQARKP